MSTFWSNVSPRRAIRDIWQILGAPSEFRFPALAIAALITGSIFWLMVNQEGRALPPPPKILYFESWRADRSDKDIIAGNIKAAREAKAQAAAEEARAEDMRQMYKAVGSATGLDTDTMYKQGKIDRIAEDKARAAKDQALLNRFLDKGAKPVIDPEATATP
ncbi:hypothetical protein [Novosphingobium sp.]|uniref:hypothetical protein n=1 Tax=Novosphingobium sp. TaxID=1874826 RepID=UPI003D0D8055